MSTAYFSAATIDDLMHDVVKAILNDGDPIFPSKGWAIEITGVLLELTNPRARISRTETRGKPFSCLGELCWYLAKSNTLEFIEYYIPIYRELEEDGRIYGGYGPRLFNLQGVDQTANVIKVLLRKPDSRQAVIQLFDAEDLVKKHKDIPCTCTLQFMIRSGRLNMFTNMRSNDAFLGLPHDIFCFTMLQELLARNLSVDVGTYKHAVGSLHLYAKNLGQAAQFIGEGFQATIGAAMPEMPTGDPWPAVALLLRAESEIRTQGDPHSSILDEANPYWADLIRLLQILKCKRTNDKAKIQALGAKMVSNVYAPFIDIVLNAIKTEEPV
jgi:thymidylate synthase